MSTAIPAPVVLAGVRPRDRRILTADNVVVEYRARGRAPVRAVDDVSLSVRKGETLGLVGESGCGKSSMGRSLVQLPPPTAGEVRLDGELLTGLSTAQLRPVRRRLQLVFQDPISSLNPRRTALEIVAEPLRLVGSADPRGRALEVLAEVGVDDQMARRRPHELSGGQCQRISIARAVVQEPEVLVCDEPVSALDVSVQAQVLNLLERMKAEYDLSMVFISHDLAVVSNISDRVAVMYLGKLVEIAPSADLYAAPRHHYTALLLSSVPGPRTERRAPRAGGEVGRPATSGTVGCPFAGRCPAATEICSAQMPPLTAVGPEHEVACHHPI
ncbi:MULTISPECIES: ABC transporter ATP-binding protein [unclassified Geodermatophilus]|uniref:ABC transporter ATP-binding protein n=1 Tax=unclassified Geodermatophilus TaxID=2637632 RepID=UPI003EECE54C